jgi:hypothetical protein
MRDAPEMPTRIKPIAYRRRSHPCEITADRLGDHMQRYHEKLDGSERDEFSRVRHILLDIAEGVR